MPSRGCVDDARLRRFAHDQESSCKGASGCVGISTIGSRLTGKKVNGREGWCNLRGVRLLRLASCVQLGLFVVSKLSQDLLAQNIFTWQEVRHKFEAAARTSTRCGVTALKSRLQTSKSTQLDQERGVMFNLRNAFVQVLPAKALLQSARGNLDYWDRDLAISCESRRAEEWS
jgi:hypothetical protein